MLVTVQRGYVYDMNKWLYSLPLVLRHNLKNVCKWLFFWMFYPEADILLLLVFGFEELRGKPCRTCSYPQMQIMQIVLRPFYDFSIYQHYWS